MMESSGGAAVGVDAPGSVTASSAQDDEPSYALVHVVTGETTKDLIIPQVVRHMMEQATTAGAGRPQRVAVLFLEPARVAARHAVRRRVRDIRAAAGPVSVWLVPYVGRLGVRRNAAAIARLLQLHGIRQRIVFHCRGESAVSWASALGRYFTRAGIVADIRGAAPEELLFTRGYDHVDGADDRTRSDHAASMRCLGDALQRSGAVLSVSPGMIEWLAALGVDAERLYYVPCCVSGPTYSSRDRAAVRTRLGLDGKQVFAYLGTVTGYQHIADGVVRFFRALARCSPAAHLLCISSDDDAMRAALAAGQIDPARTTVIRLHQDQVAAVLSAADAGLLLRAPSRLNSLSQPTKLAEYLAAGVPVIVSRGVGRVDQLVAQWNAGLTVELFDRTDEEVAAEARDVLERIERDEECMRANALRLCDEQFLWSRYIDRTRRAYRRVLEARRSEDVTVA